DDYNPLVVSLSNHELVLRRAQDERFPFTRLWRTALVVGALVACCATRPSAQTTALPSWTTGDRDGFLTRADWLLSVGAMRSGDPRFAWSIRNRFDLDLAQYPQGRVNFFFDNEVVLGRERREFDFNHGNIVFETSASARLGGVDASLV